jgi:hypothetical protein
MYCQVPLRLVQLFVLTICGLGYSGKGLAGLTFAAQGVRIFAAATCALVKKNKLHTEISKQIFFISIVIKFYKAAIYFSL